MMDELRLARTRMNAALLPKRPSAWVMVGAGTVGSWFFSMPDAQRQMLLNLLPLPAWAVPIVISLVGLGSQVWARKHRVAPDEGVSEAVIAPLMKNRDE